jgi:alpha,alpha-trehalase
MLFMLFGVENEPNEYYSRRMIKKLLTAPRQLPLPKRTVANITFDDTEKALSYISKHWDKLRRYQPEDNGTIIGLPNAFIIPSADPRASFNFEEQYYWDSYFTALGMLDKGHEEIVTGMLENLLHLLRRFGMVPNASRMYMMSRSQPPLLTSFIFMIYERYGKSEEWLAEHMAVAEQEYRHVWMSDRHPYWHLVDKGLNRYYDINVLHDLAEAESGWDMTPRFERKCLDYLPVDLNSLLYKYETDFARTCEILGDKKTAKEWLKRADIRRQAMNNLMWGRLRGFYFDYNFEKQELGSVWSLAGFYPMWAGLANEDQARTMVDNLLKFEKRGGLTTTTRPLIDMSIFGSLPTQWAYPNGWAPLHYFVIEGLRRYGYHDDADRISRKWLRANLDWFVRHGEFIEKYNVVNPKKRPVEGVYPSQSGFGWTNGVFVHLCTSLGLTDKK